MASGVRLLWQPLPTALKGVMMSNQRLKCVIESLVHMQEYTYTHTHTHAHAHTHTVKQIPKQYNIQSSNQTRTHIYTHTHTCNLNRNHSWRTCQLPELLFNTHTHSEAGRERGKRRSNWRESDSRSAAQLHGVTLKAVLAAHTGCEIQRL